MTTPLEAPGAQASVTPLRRNRPYLLLMSGKTTQIVGEGVGVFAMPLVAFGLTHSVALSGVIAAVGEAGSLLATLPAGVASDRLDRRRLLMTAAVVGLVLWAFAAVGGLAGRLTGWELAVILFGVSVVTAIFGAAEVGAIRSVVAPGQMASAMAAIQGRGAVASLISGPIGGVLYAVSHAVPFAAGALGHAAVVVCTAFVREPLNSDRATAKATHPVAQLGEGIRFFASLPVLRNSLWLIMLINLTVSGTMVAINLQLVRTHTAPLLIGALDAVSGAAMLLGALLAPALIARAPSGRILMIALSVMAASFLCMAVVHSYAGYLVFVALGALLIPALNAGVGGYVAAIVPDALQGRVSSVSSLGYLAIAPIAPVVASLLLAHLGIVPTLWVFAAALAAGVIGTSLVRELRRIGTPDSWAADAIEWPRPEASAHPAR